jgi:hypothetical protein
MMIRSLALLLVAAVLPAGGQEVHADGILTSTTSWDATTPLVGMSVSLDHVRLGFASLRIGAEYSGSVTTRQVAACFSPDSGPSGCVFDSSQDKTRLVMGTAGLELRASEKHASLAVFGDLGMGRVTRSEAGLNDSHRTMWSALIGASWAWRFNELWGIRAEGGVGSMGPYHPTDSQNGYSPFATGFHTSRLSLGAFWTGESRAR